MNKLILLLLTLPFPAFSMHPPTLKRSLSRAKSMGRASTKHTSAPAQQFDWGSVPQSELEAKTDADAKSEVKQKTSVNYTDLTYDEAFAVTGFSKEIQKTVKDYLKPPLKFFPAFTLKKIVQTGNTFGAIMLSNRYFTADVFNGNGIISIFDIDTGTCVQQLPQAFLVERIIAMPNGSLVVSIRGFIFIWNPLTKILSQTINLMHSELIRSGDQIVTSLGTTLRSWNIESGKTTHTIQVPNLYNDTILEIYSLPNQEILIRPLEGKFIIWNLETGLRTIDFQSTSHDGIVVMANGLIVKKSADSIEFFPGTIKLKSKIEVYDPINEKLLMKTIKAYTGLFIAVNEHAIAIRISR
jgi:WD40 repeat protein